MVKSGKTENHIPTYSTKIISKKTTSAKLTKHRIRLVEWPERAMRRKKKIRAKTRMSLNSYGTSPSFVTGVQPSSSCSVTYVHLLYTEQMMFTHQDHMIAPPCIFFKLIGWHVISLSSITRSSLYWTVRYVLTFPFGMECLHCSQCFSRCAKQFPVISFTIIAAWHLHHQDKTCGSSQIQRYILCTEVCIFKWGCKQLYSFLLCLQTNTLWPRVYTDIPFN